MSRQEQVERDVRMAIGDLSMQVILARAEIMELREQLAEAQLQEQMQSTQASKVNGSKVREARVE